MTSISSNNIQHSETSFATGVGAVAGFGGYVASEALLSKTRNRYLYKSLEKIPQYGDESEALVLPAGPS